MVNRNQRWLERIERSKRYQEIRNRLQAKWRPPILKRDGATCRNCGAKEELHVAHITDAVDFVRVTRTADAVTFSYRWDNLYLLCAPCHRISHRYLRTLDAEELVVRKQVEKLEASLRKLRGWSSVHSALPPHLVPSGIHVPNPFHDRMRISPLVPFPSFGEYCRDGGAFEAPPEPTAPKQAMIMEAWQDHTEPANRIENP